MVPQMIVKPLLKTWASFWTVGCSPIGNTSTTSWPALRQRCPECSVSSAISVKALSWQLYTFASKSSTSQTSLDSSSCSMLSWQPTTICTVSSISIWWTLVKAWERALDSPELPFATSESDSSRISRGKSSAISVSFIASQFSLTKLKLSFFLIGLAAVVHHGSTQE